MNPRPGPNAQAVYGALGCMLALVGFVVGQIIPRFVAMVLFGLRIRRSHPNVLELVCWGCAIVGVLAGLKTTHLLYRRHFPAVPKAGDPRPDYDDVRSSGRES